MRPSKTLAKLRAGKVVKMCSLGHFIPAYVHLAADAGYDCIWLDLEHRLIDEREVQCLLALCHHADIDCLLRASTLEKSRLYRYLEDGATGIMIPHVSTEEKAHMLAQSVKFPPIGDRGLDGVGLDAGYLLGPMDEYTEFANRETFLVVQIETPQAVENADKIAAVSGVDGLFIGPGDLGLRLQKLPDCELTFEEAVERVATAAAKHGKAWGLPVANVEDLKKYEKQGAQILAHGNDYFAMMNMFKQCVSAYEGSN